MNDHDAVQMRMSQIADVRRLQESGLKNDAIAKTLDIPESTVRHILKNWTK